MSVRRVVVNGDVRWQACVARGGRRISTLCATREEARLAEAELYQRLTSTEVRSVEALVAWLGTPSFVWERETIQRLRQPMVYVWIEPHGGRELTAYVGQSAKGIARPLSGDHHRRDDLDGRLLCWCVESPEAAAALEAEIIHHCAPRYNIQRPHWQRPWPQTGNLAD